jgi:hypothetical protein
MDMDIKIGFKEQLVSVAIDDIVTIKTNIARIMRGRKYKQILKSIQSVGIIEPPVIIWKNEISKYILLDGHLRIEALKELGTQTVSCLISNDDESYTYNKYVNRLSPIQANKMINKAISKGISEEKIATALDRDIKSITQKRDMLHGISHEVIELLKDKVISEKNFRLLRKMKPIRQLVATKLMLDNNKFTYGFLKNIFDTSRDDDLLIKKRKQKMSNEILENRILLERENLILHGDIQSIRDEYGINMINFTALQKYIHRLMKNEKVADFIRCFDEDVFDLFSKVIAIDPVTLDKIE